MISGTPPQGSPTFFSIDKEGTLTDVANKPFFTRIVKVAQAAIKTTGEELSPDRLQRIITAFNKRYSILKKIPLIGEWLFSSFRKINEEQDEAIKQALQNKLAMITPPSAISNKSQAQDGGTSQSQTQTELTNPQQGPIHSEDQDGRVSARTAPQINASRQGDESSTSSSPKPLPQSSQTSSTITQQNTEAYKAEPPLTFSPLPPIAPQITEPILKEKDQELVDRAISAFQSLSPIDVDLISSLLESPSASTDNDLLAKIDTYTKTHPDIWQDSPFCRFIEIAIQNANQTTQSLVTSLYISALLSKKIKNESIEKLSRSFFQNSNLYERAQEAANALLQHVGDTDTEMPEEQKTAFTRAFFFALEQTKITQLNPFRLQRQAVSIYDTLFQHLKNPENTACALIPAFQELLTLLKNNNSFHITLEMLLSHDDKTIVTKVLTEITQSSISDTDFFSLLIEYLLQKGLTEPLQILLQQGNQPIATYLLKKLSSKDTTQTNKSIKDLLDSYIQSPSSQTTRLSYLLKEAFSMFETDEEAANNAIVALHVYIDRFPDALTQAISQIIHLPAMTKDIAQNMLAKLLSYKKAPQNKIFQKLITTYAQEGNAELRTIIQNIVESLTKSQPSLGEEPPIHSQEKTTVIGEHVDLNDEDEPPSVEDIKEQLLSHFYGDNKSKLHEFVQNIGMILQSKDTKEEYKSLLCDALDEGLQDILTNIQANPVAISNLTQLISNFSSGRQSVLRLSLRTLLTQENAAAQTVLDNLPPLPPAAPPTPTPVPEQKAEEPPLLSQASSLSKDQDEISFLFQFALSISKNLDSFSKTKLPKVFENILNEFFTSSDHEREKFTCALDIANNFTGTNIELFTNILTKIMEDENFDIHLKERILVQIINNQPDAEQLDALLTTFFNLQFHIYYPNDSTILDFLMTNDTPDLLTAYINNKTIPILEKEEILRNKFDTNKDTFALLLQHFIKNSIDKVECILTLTHLPPKYIQEKLVADASPLIQNLTVPEKQRLFEALQSTLPEESDSTHEAWISILTSLRMPSASVGEPERSQFVGEATGEANATPGLQRITRPRPSHPANRITQENLERINSYIHLEKTIEEWISDFKKNQKIVKPLLSPQFINELPENLLTACINFYFDNITEDSRPLSEVFLLEKLSNECKTNISLILYKKINTFEDETVIPQQLQDAFKLFVLNPALRDEQTEIENDTSIIQSDTSEPANKIQAALRLLTYIRDIPDGEQNEQLLELLKKYFSSIFNDPNMSEVNQLFVRNFIEMDPLSKAWTDLCPILMPYTTD